MSHTLIVLDDSDGGGWDIEHVPGCWREVSQEDVSYLVADRCIVDRVIENDPQALDPIEHLEPGRYPVLACCEGEGERYEEWIVIVIVIVVPGLE